MDSRATAKDSAGAALIELALALGASAAVLIPPGALAVEDRFAALCAEPHRCPSYGLAPGCPPHAMRPAAFRELLRRYRQILVFKIDAPAAALMGPERLEIARRIHCLAATIEEQALAGGFHLAKGMAAGSCKELFCPEDPACVVLARALPCPHAGCARPSISAVGVDFSRLAATAGWPFGKIEPGAAATNDSAMGLMAGLVLLR